MSEETTQQDAETLAKVKDLLDEALVPGQSEDETPYINKAPEDIPAPRIETDRNTTFDASVSSQTGMYSWNMSIDGLGDITVSDTEKAMYLKSVLHDVPVVLPIDLEMHDENNKVSIEIRTLNNYEMDLVFWALEKDRLDGILTSPAALATRLQYYAGGLQSRKINTQPISNIEFPTPGSMIEDGEKLRVFVNEYIKKINWPRWQAILVALRIFETKVKICNDASLNGNFWKPQGADS